MRVSKLIQLLQVIPDDANIAIQTCGETILFADIQQIEFSPNIYIESSEENSAFINITKPE